MTLNDWITAKEGAALYQLEENYFRRKFCCDGGPLSKLHGLRTRIGPRGGRRIFVSRQVILDLMEQERKHSERE